MKIEIILPIAKLNSGIRTIGPEEIFLKERVSFFINFLEKEQGKIIL